MPIQVPNISEFEDVVYKTVDGVRVIAAVHSTKRGPALGGCRLLNYNSFEEQLNDTLRLAEAMSYKNAFANLDLGGGKMTVDLNGLKTTDDKVIKAIAETVNSLNGKYYTAKDVGFDDILLNCISSETPYVRGFYSGDPSRSTADGVISGILSSLDYARINRNDARVGVEGLGGVGYRVAGQLIYNHHIGELYIEDIDQSKVDDFIDHYRNHGTKVYPMKNLKYADIDIYCPCALGGTIDDYYEKIQAKIIAGAANNQMKNNEISKAIFESGKIYAPDFVINSGGVIHITQEFKTKNRIEISELASEQCNEIGNSLISIYTKSKKYKKPTDQLATEMAKQMLC